MLELKNLAFSVEGEGGQKEILKDISLTVEDGDLTPCLDIPYARCDKGKKHYNRKDKDLPKEHDGSGFHLI